MFNALINFVFDQKLKKVKALFDYYFFYQKYFLKQSASELEFSNLLNINVTILNNVSKTYYSTNFTNLIQEYRYLHLINEFENPINADLPFESILKFSGFENNLSFVEYVKAKSVSKFKL